MSDLQILFNKIRETHLSEKIDKAADACRANVTIYHYDTLQTESKPRRLPDGIEVIVFDETGKPFRSKIDGGKSVHKNVRCGYISWQLAGGESASNAYTKQDNRHLTEKSENTPLKASDGMVLIKARNKMSDAEFIYQPEPLKQLAVPVFAGRRRIRQRQYLRRP